MSNTTSDKRKSYPVQIMQKKHYPFPKLYLGIYVSGPPEDRYGFPQLFARAGCHAVENPEKADLVVFTGGPDVNPTLYGEKPHSKTYWDTDRDAKDIELYTYCRDNGIPMMGVCRGAQFLHVMQGGKLFQDVNNHNGTHYLFDTRNNQAVNDCSSVHHQAVIRNVGLGMLVLGEVRKSTQRALNDTVIDTTVPFPDVEAFAYPEMAIFAVQGHPEYGGYDEFAQWTLNRLEEFFDKSSVIDKSKYPRRIKKTIVERRNKERTKKIEKTAN